MANRIYGAMVIKERAAGTSRKSGKTGHARKTVICPFTLEASRDCTLRLRAPNSFCRFTLDICRISR
jgi:hypothetical protein